MKPGFKETGL